MSIHVCYNKQKRAHKKGFFHPGFVNPSQKINLYGAGVISIILTMLVVKWVWNIESNILEMQMEMTPIYNMIDDNPPMDSNG